MSQADDAMKTVRQRLRAEYPPGEELPDEEMLAASYGVSRKLVREAVSRMVVEGALEKRWGVGTFALDTKPPGNFGLLSIRSGVVASLSATGSEVTLPISSMTISEADEAAFPDFPDSKILNIYRVYALDGSPAIFIRDSIVAESGDKRIDTGTGDWMSLLIADLLAQIGLNFTELKMHLDARLCSNEEAEHLAMRTHSPVLSAAGHALDETGRTLLYVNSVIRTDVIQPVVSSDLLNPTLSF